MKRHRLEGRFLEQLKTVPNISIACEKTGLSRNTVYRWMNDEENEDFKKKVEEALDNGIESINDLAESKIIGQINSGNLKATMYWLDNHKKTYMRPRPRDFWENSQRRIISGITITVVEPKPGAVTEEDLERMREGYEPRTKKLMILGKKDPDSDEDDY